jgi:CheY-like chemotaxis protein
MSEAADRRAAETGAHGAVLIVDDDRATLSGLSLLLQHRGITIYEASTGVGAVRSALAHRPDVLVLDNRLGSPEDMTGIDVIDALHAQSFFPTWILYSGLMNFELAADAGRRHVFSVIGLPSTEIDDAVMEALTATRRGEAGGWPLLPVGPLTGAPETNAGRGARWILAACDSPDDLPSFPAWAGFVDASDGRMRDLYKQMRLDPHQVKSFTRCFRALTRACGHVENAVAELTVGDARTLAHLQHEAGLNRPPAAVRIPLEQFLRTQTFVPADHALLTTMRSLIATRNLSAFLKR